MDDKKINHVESKVVIYVIDIIEGYFCDITIYRRKKSTFLSMNITFREGKTLEIETKDKLK